MIHKVHSTWVIWRSKTGNKLVLCRIIVPLANKNLFLHQDNTPARIFTLAKLVEMDYKLLLHTPYFLDLVPCYLFLIPNLRKSFPVRKFQSNKEVLAATEIHFQTLRKRIFQTIKRSWNIDRSSVMNLRVTILKINLYFRKNNLQAKNLSDHSCNSSEISKTFNLFRIAFVLKIIC